MPEITPLISMLDAVAALREEVEKLQVLGLEIHDHDSSLGIKPSHERDFRQERQTLSDMLRSSNRRIEATSKKAFEAISALQEDRALVREGATLKQDFFDSCKNAGINLGSLPLGIDELLDAGDGTAAMKAVIQGPGPRAFGAIARDAMLRGTSMTNTAEVMTRRQALHMLGLTVDDLGWPEDEIIR